MGRQPGAAQRLGGPPHTALRPLVLPQHRGGGGGGVRLLAAILREAGAGEGEVRMVEALGEQQLDTSQEEDEPREEPASQQDISGDWGRA